MLLFLFAKFDLILLHIMFSVALCSYSVESDKCTESQCSLLQVDHLRMYLSLSLETVLVSGFDPEVTNKLATTSIQLTCQTFTKSATCCRFFLSLRKRLSVCDNTA